MWCVFYILASATYGLTENGIKERCQQLNRWINTCVTLKDKRKIGLPIKVKDRQFMKKEDAFRWADTLHVALPLLFPCPQRVLSTDALFWFFLFLIRRAELEQLQDATPAHIDITNKVQRIVEMQGGLEFILNKKEFDPNFTFGNPRKVKTFLNL